MDKPNILWIGLDQIRADTLQQKPEKVCCTPNMDSLSKSGVSFTRAYTPCSLCSPARASMFTGRYAFIHGMGTNCDMYHSLASELQDPDMLLHTHFQEAGYRCGYAGKWHVGTEKGPRDYGFEGMNLSGYGNIMKDPGFQAYLADNGLSHTPEPMHYLNPGKQTLIGGRWGGPVESTPAHYLANYTMGMMDEFSQKGTPFFITCQFWGPHGPHMPSDEFYQLHDRSKLEPWKSLREDMTRKPRRIERELQSFFRNHPRTWEEAREIVGLYYDSAAMLDYEIGRLLDYLEDHDLARNTIVVLSADHGDMTGAHGGMMDKGLLYEEAHHIPLIITWKGSIVPGVSEDLAMNMDIMPTLMDLADIPVPEGLDGMSLKDALNRKSGRTIRNDLYLEFHGLRFLYSQRAVITSDGWKYIFTPGDFDEVYNLENDPDEMDNLIDSPFYSEKVKELQERIREAAAVYQDPLRDCVSKFFGIWQTGSRQVDASKFYDT
jgi:arylsulfatase A-like enzyme